MEVIPILLLLAPPNMLDQPIKPLEVFSLDTMVHHHHMAMDQDMDKLAIQVDRPTMFQEANTFWEAKMLYLLNTPPLMLKS